MIKVMHLYSCHVHMWSQPNEWCTIGSCLIMGAGWLVIGQLCQWAHCKYDFPSKFKFNRISFCIHPDSPEEVTTKFCTCHNSTAVVACAKICSDVISKDVNYRHRVLLGNLLFCRHNHKYNGPLSASVIWTSLTTIQYMSCQVKCE